MISRLREWWIILPDRLKMLSWRLSYGLHANILRLIDRYLEKRGEQRVVVMDFDDIPIMWEQDDFRTLVDDI